MTKQILIGILFVAIVISCILNHIIIINVIGIITIAFCAFYMEVINKAYINKQKDLLNELYEKRNELMGNENMSYTKNRDDINMNRLVQGKNKQ